MTKQEKHLWYDFLKKLPVTVKRQYNIEDYILDFYIAKHKLAIEIDGVQHTEPEHISKDKLRDKNLAKWGIRVLRYYNKDINNNFDGVVSDILNNIGLSFNDLK